MLAGPTPEYPPLLKPGKHPMTLAQARSLCTNVSLASTTRNPIMAGVEKLIADVQAVGLQGEVWLNGSFVTQKIDPQDADLVFVFDEAVIRAATPDQGQMLQNLTTRNHFKATHRCDAYVTFVCPPGHQHYLVSLALLAYWNSQWATDRNNAPKGYAIIGV